VLGANPARIIPAWRHFVDEHGAAGRPVRGVGEPVWAGREPAELAECQLHEALLNLAVEPDTPLWLVCPYDAAALPDGVLEEAGRSHPVLVEGGVYSGSTAYAGAAHVESLFRQELPEPDAEVEELLFDERSLDVVRLMVQSRAEQTALGATRTADLTLAVAEAAGNSVRHGGGQGRLKVWRQDGALVCEVRDGGHIADPMVGRRLPSLDSTGGRGMWLISQLSELSQVRSTASGTAVRVLSRVA
jgi:anti-sigma regulatory factor (Ser/Thr protein kinase)